MNPEQQAAFSKLLIAQTAYIEAHAFEVDQGGTIRVVRTIGSQKILADLCHTEVVRFERKKWPVLSDDQIAGSNALLDREYHKKIQQLRTLTNEEINEGAVTASNLS